MKKRVIFVNRFFFPDRSASSQLLGDLAFHLARSGHAVSVIASRQRYDDPRARLPPAESIARVEVHRVATTRFGRAALLARGLDYASFYASAWRRVLAIAERGDILVATTDPPMLGVAAMRLARRRSLHLVNWLQDLYPEVAVRLGVPLLRGAAAATLVRVRNASLRAAAANVVVSDGMASNLRAQGIAGNALHVIENWCDDETIGPLSPDGNPFRRAWRLEGRFVIAYSGNLGRGHEYDTVLAAAQRLRGDPRMMFLCVGGGQKLEALKRRVAALGLDASFRFIAYQDRDKLACSLTAADVHWISLKPELEGLVMPSKLYGIAAAGRPIIAIVSRDGEIAGLVNRYACGVVIEPGDGAALAQALARLALDPDACAEMGRRARTMLDRRFTRAQALERWCRLIETIA